MWRDWKEGSAIDVDNEGYKYLWSLEKEEKSQQRMNEKVNQEYFKRIKSIIKIKRNVQNAFQAIIIWKVPKIS